MKATNAYVSRPTEQDVERLRFDARLAYLDGRVKRAKDLNKQADKMAADLRKQQAATVGEVR
jgi:hypothetical protein